MTGFAILLRYWWAAVIAGLVLIVGAQQVRVSNAKSEMAALRTIYAQAALKAEQEARAKETTREQEKQEIIDAANQQAEDAIAAVSAADAAATSLRQQLAKYSAAIRANTSAGKGSPNKSGADAFDLLSRVLAGMDDSASEVSLYADRLRIAGAACEKQYDSLK